MRDDTAAGAEHVATVVIDFDIVFHTHATAVDGDFGKGLFKRCVLRLTDLRRTNGSQRTAAIHIAVDQTAVDFNLGELSHRT